METAPKSKRGRKRKPYRASDGKHIDGLRWRPHDGRWVVVDTGQTFTAHTEAEAIAKFQRLTENEDELSVRSFERAAHPYDNPKHQIWRWFADQIRSRPLWVAAATGIEQIGYLCDLKPIEPLASFADLETAWKLFAPCGADELRKVLAHWRYFVKTANISDLRHITPATVVAFRDKVYARADLKKGKSQQHLFNHVRRMLTFARSRAIKIPADIFDALKLLTPNSTTVTLAPEPIEPSDFKKLLDTAEGDDKALLLLLLNGAMYLKEAVDLHWDDIKDGCLIAHRRKKGSVLRVAVLWPETLEALATIKRNGDHIFHSVTGEPLTVSGAGKRFRRIRKAAKVNVNVKANQLRDGAYSAAVAANVSDDLCKLLMGHRHSGVHDNYALRRPSMVAPACDAIHKHYFGQ